MEKIEKGVIGRAYAQVTESASGKDFKPFFERYISKTAQIIEDE